MNTRVEAPCLSVSDDLLSSFADGLSHFPVPRLAVLREACLRTEVFAVARRVYSDCILSARSYLDDPDIGVCSIDIGSSSREIDEKNAFLRTLSALALCFAISPLLDDPRLGLPFTLYQSSTGNEAKLQDKDIRFYSPTVKLGFHNDGAIHQDLLFIPSFVSLLNLFIGYNKPGHFYWLPLSRWAQFEELASRFEGHSYTLEVTPIVYQSDLDSHASNSSRFFAAPMFYRNAHGERRAFINGIMRSTERGTDDFDAVSASLLNNDFRYVIPQRVFRLSIFANALGIHSRDIFGGQFVTNGVTRSHIRTMSRASEDATGEFTRILVGPNDVHSTTTARDKKLH